ncbi:hypothetical protein AJ80_04102 [Polytolypa hystricis UAMH7299]|uniref:Tyrosinase copper-binding domain-containing protein n=1 Tax=Polytolypa hystricis (strain UAMH7299) TaxID=1447883 RepID=A0A2B7YF50_POLH7|nr:hypothetical protein AJ80_04102 [Polytolypa hystricis UAMH7299]
MSSLTRRRGGRFSKSLIPPIAARNLSPRRTNRLEILDYKHGRVLNQESDSNVANDTGQVQVGHQHITGARLYDICCGRRSANFDGDFARFHIEPKEFYIAHARLARLSESEKPRYVHKDDVEYVRKQGAENFSALGDMNPKILEPSDPDDSAGPLRAYGMHSSAENSTAENMCRLTQFSNCRTFSLRQTIAFDKIILPAGKGGGCVKTGPFKDMVVNLGPKDPPLQVDGVVGQKGDGLDYNPRCLRCDILPEVAKRWTKTEDVLTLIEGSPDTSTFQNVTDGNPFIASFVTSRPTTIVLIVFIPRTYIVPGDPAFYLHHAMVDRTYWTWQNLDPKKRLTAINGPVAPGARPPTREITLDDIIDLGILLKPWRVGDLMDTAGGPFCYIYI